jgi:diguanylate cyclase (GGDEF)-like protein/PAS domain S-box-containing protein
MMDSPLLSPDDTAGQLRRVHQFLAWTYRFNSSFAILQALAYIVFRDARSGLMALLLGGCSGIVLLARAQARKNRLIPAVTTTCLALLGAVIVVALLQPALMPTLVMIPFVAVAFALPYVNGQLLLRLIVAAWLTQVIVVFIGELLPAASELPPWFATTFRISSLIATGVLVLLLLWQFSSRLNDTLARTRASEERYARAVSGANDGIWDWDLVENRIHFSHRWKSMLGYSSDDIGTVADEWYSRIHPDDVVRVRAELSNHLDALTPYFESEHRMRNSAGRYQWMLCRGLAVRDDSGRAIRMAGSQTDITRRKQVEEQLAHDAFHDALTELPNRALFMERLGRAIVRTKRHPEHSYTVLFLDLDLFKIVNDSLGHSAGDQLLVVLARRLRACVRPSDTVARLGGDEFAILLDGPHDSGNATLVADRIIGQATAPYMLNDHEIFSAVSIGIAPGSREYERPEDVLRDADIALYRAKALGRGRWIVFDPSMHEHALTRLQVETDLRRAVEREEFVVYYQPVIDLQTGKVTGFEALVRWQHPQRGLLPPAEFITIAEETGMIVPLGWIVLRVACQELNRWAAEIPGGEQLTVSVNVSGAQFAQTELITHIQRVINEAETIAARLHLEITESVMIDNAEITASVLAYLRTLGIRLHIDDFGTGYSSLSALHRFPISALKVDRSFVSRIGMSGAKAEEMIETIVALSHRLGIEVIAEGVETTEQLAYLRTIGCNYAQGYLFSRPMPASEVAKFVTTAPCW